MLKIKILFFSLLIFAFITPVFAAEDEENASEAPVSNWTYTWRASLNGTQAAYSNWSQGGVNSLAIIGTSVASAKYQSGKNKFSSHLDLRYGQTRIEDEDFRKSADLIRWRNKYIRQLEDERWGLLAQVNFESQFDVGRNKNTNQIESDFFSPAYITEILGISYQPNEFFSAAFGAAAKQTIVMRDSLVTRYGVREGENFRNELGFSLILQYEREIVPNILYSGYLETFTNPTNNVFRSDFLFTNELTGRITDNISANFELSFQYNQDFIDEIQVKQILAIGFTYVIR